MNTINFNGKVQIKIENPQVNKTFHTNMSNSPLSQLLKDNDIRANMDLFERSTPDKSSLTLTIKNAETDNPFLYVETTNVPNNLKSINENIPVDTDAKSRLNKLIESVNIWTWMSK